MVVRFVSDDGDTINFGVDISSSSQLPLTVLDESGVRTWETGIRVLGATATALLADKQCKVTVRPGLGASDNGTILIEGLNAGGNPGRFGNLTIPLSEEGQQTWRAVLGSCSILGEIYGNNYLCAVRFMIGSRVS